MAIDFNNEEEQKERSNGTIPPGSKVLVVLSIEKPTYAHDLHDYVSVSKQGLLGLWVKYTVIAGTYEGSKWHENIWLQEGQQEINLNDGQRTACRIGGARIRAIIEASRGIMPEDKSPKAARARVIGDWLDLNGMRFPVKVGISKEAVKSKSGQLFWPNVTLAVLTPDKEDYTGIMEGGEVISSSEIPSLPNNAPTRRNSGSSAGPRDDGAARRRLQRRHSVLTHQPRRAAS